LEAIDEAQPPAGADTHRIGFQLNRPDTEPLDMTNRVVHHPFAQPASAVVGNDNQITDPRGVLEPSGGDHGDRLACHLCNETTVVVVLERDLKLLPRGVPAFAGRLRDGEVDVVGREWSYTLGHIGATIILADSLFKLDPTPASVRCILK